MPTVTTRFCDPDTGKILGPDLPVKGQDLTTKLGSYFDVPTPPAVPAAPPVVTLQPATGPAPSVAEADLAALKAGIRTLGRAEKQGDKDAATTLKAIRDAEYAREDGGRRPVKMILNGFGHGSPVRK